MEFVNGKDDIPYINGKDYIPYMKWKIKFMFETTNQSCNGVIPLFPLLHHHSLLPRPMASSTRRFELLVSSRAVMRCSTSVWFLKKKLERVSTDEPEGRWATTSDPSAGLPFLVFAFNILLPGGRLRQKRWLQIMKPPWIFSDPEKKTTTFFMIVVDPN